MGRPAKMQVVCGDRGQGKSYTTRLELVKQAQKNNRKGLIIDINNENDFFPTIKIWENGELTGKYIAQYGIQTMPEIRRVGIYKDNGDLMDESEFEQALVLVLQNYFNGFLLVEDLTGYVGDHYNKSIIGRICRLRHKSVDIFIHFQFIGKAGNPKLLGSTNVIRLHKTKDTILRHKDKFEDYYEILKIAENIIHQDYFKAVRGQYSSENELMGIFVDGNYKSGYVYIDFDDYKIYGKFKKTDFLNAIDQYINENSKIKINPMLNRMNENGGKKYNYESALNHIRETLFLNYYPLK